MNFRSLLMFVTLCDNDYFVTKTAEQLGVTQPSISNAIKELEKYYGVKLFDRIGRRLRITSAGLKLLEYSRLVVQRYNDLEREFRNWDRLGELRIGTSNSFHSQRIQETVSGPYSKGNCQRVLKYRRAHHKQ